MTCHYIQKTLKTTSKKTVKTTTSYWIQIDIQKSTAFLSTNSKLPEREMKKEISFTIASKTIKK